MAGRGTKDIDEQLALALAIGGTVADAARTVNCCEKTVRRRLKDEKFRQGIVALRNEMVSRAVGRLSGLGILAADTLHNLLSSGSEKIRLSAARAGLDFMFRGHELETLTKEVEALRRVVEELSNAKSDAE
jgi:hypothetical protein